MTMKSSADMASFAVINSYDAACQTQEPMENQSADSYFTERIREAKRLQRPHMKMNCDGATLTQMISGGES